ncbi:tRNA pseudouridine(55) synthase TruB [Bariatricus sp. SGI.154]|uniref:tRNA pseudouridine(55) synthase TruB n=1 Tax=Bariatricus sp. SGI.154 TaxID=3420549 RepID=UPI003D06C800
MIHGVLNVYKEKGFTSHDVVAKLRGITGQRKIGHTGTLDPDATGVLPVCLGRATKLCDMLTDKDKTYEAVLLLGKTTDTQDISGQVLSTMDTSYLQEEEVQRTIEQFVGEYAQIPPMYSALKVNGRKLYELAREGKVVERKARLVRIHEIRILEMRLPRVRMEVTCSKGTYIRTLCQDIGEKLGCGGCMEELVRTRVSRFKLAESMTLDEIRRLQEEGTLEKVLVPIDAMFDAYKKMFVKERWDSLAKNGNALPARAVVCACGHKEDQDMKEKTDLGMEDQESVRLYDEVGQFIGIYRWQKEKKEYRIVKMFLQS